MRKSTVRLNLLILVIFSLTACSVKPTVTATVSPLPTPTIVASPTVSDSATPRETNTPLPSPTLALIPSPTVIQQPPLVTNWTTFVFTDGVSIDYPVGWTVIVPSVYYFVDFRPATESNTDSNFSVRLEVYGRPIHDRAGANPHSWEGNEGGYEVQWEKLISIDGAEGLEFVWGETRDNQWETPPELMAVYYSERYELDVRLTTFFNRQSIEIAQTLGFTDTISSTFSVFEHMVQSVRISR